MAILPCFLLSIDMTEYNKETVKNMISLAPILRIGDDEFIDLREVEFKESLINLDRLDQARFELNRNGVFITTDEHTIMFIGKQEFEELVMRYLEYNGFYNVESGFKLNFDNYESEYIWYVKANV